SSSPFIRAWAAAEMASSHRAPIWIISTCSRSSCSPNLFLTLRPSLAEPAGDVVFCALVRGGGEQCLRPAELHQIPQQEKRRVVGDTGGLLHIVGHHDDSILAFQFHCKVFDLGGGDGVQGAGGLIHQQDLRLHCQGTGNAQPLLLAAGEAQGTLLQPVLHLVPDGGGAERVLHDLVQLGPGADAVGPGAVGHVVIDAHREGIGLLEHHADLLAQPGGVHIGGVDVLPGVVDLPLNADARYQVIHPVQGLQKGGL
ncbi:sporulation transcription factor Spo0A, partial [Dysosmobacter welbionis]